jgi:hypothetical protein
VVSTIDEELAGRSGEVRLWLKICTETHEALECVKEKYPEIKKPDGSE